MTRSCAHCQFFAETVANPVPASRGECRRYPVPLAPISRDYWCGEFRAKVTDNE
jgi:hypothetical protein